jgi:hypothetical protein
MGTNKFTSVAGHFDGHLVMLKQYMQNCPMQHVQGYTESHWTLPSGDYSLCIAPVAARATANKTKMKTYTYFAGHYGSPGNAPVSYRAHHLMEEVLGFTRSHWMPPLGKYYVQ